MAYVKKFEKPYSDGYKDKPDLTTPITADILNMQDRTFESIESFLQEMQTDFPDNVEINNSITVGIKKSGAIKGNGSISSGIQCEASYYGAFANGIQCTASGQASHAEGTTCTASGQASHAEGTTCTASGQASHAEGTTCTASGQASHAEGAGTKASEYMAHSEGNGTVAGGAGSHAEGYGTKATADFQHVQGKYNLEDTEKKYAHIVGGGSSDSDRKNIHTIDWNGNAEFAGDVTNGNGVSLDGLDGKIAELASSGISRLVVDSLPTEDIKTNVIYFLPLSSVGENNIYEEYMYINEKWELIGTTQVDLSQYYTKEESDDLLAEKANKIAFENHANDKDIHVTVAEKEKWNTEAIADAEVSDYLTIENSVAGGLKLNQLYGKSEQKQYSGKNLLRATLGNVTRDGVTLTANGDGTYTLNGTATDNTDFLLATSFNIVKDKNYRITGVQNGGNYRIYIMDGNVVIYDTGKGVNFVYSGDSSSNKAVHLLINKNVTYNNVIVKPMIADASLYSDATYDDFEPYVGGIPSPNPDYPQEIKTVVNPAVKVTGKNLLNPTLQTATKNGVTCTNNGDGTYTLNGTATKLTEFVLSAFTEKKDRKYRLIGSPKSVSEKTYRLDIFASNEPSKNDVGNGVTFNTSANKHYTIRILAFTNATMNNVVFKPMLTTDTSATYDDFEPYTSQSVTLTGVTLNAIPVSSGRNVTIDGQQYISDYVDVEHGKIVRMVDSSKLDSTQSIINNTDWVLATPTEESLTADQLSALQALQTYYSQTNVFVTSEELPPMVELEYGLNKVGGYTLEALNTARANAVKLNSFLSSQNESENTTNEQE